MAEDRVSIYLRNAGIYLSLHGDNPEQQHRRPHRREYLKSHEVRQ
jgi:hypothetical protein